MSVRLDNKVNVFERLVARAMDSVQAIREQSEEVGALVTCGFFYIVATTRGTGTATA
jgi:hypothetical protein